MKSLKALAALVALSAALSACYRNLAGVDLSDAAIKARIEAQLQAHREVDPRHLVLDVHARIATVSGVVRTWEERLLVEQIVKRTAGVEQALVNLVIQE